MRLVPDALDDRDQPKEAVTGMATLTPPPFPLVKEYRTADDCPDAKKHTRCPSGYLAWHEWADKKAKTHRQTQCSTCGYWSIWVPKKGAKA